MPIGFTHIINPYKVDSGSPDETIHRITIQSIRQAAAEGERKGVKITLCATTFVEEEDFIPEGFLKLSPLREGKVRGGHFRLPYIQEILLRSLDLPDESFVIYSNMDIILMPYFYSEVNAWINKGHDALLINRRRLSKRYLKPEWESFLYSDMGLPHPGYDCFVIKKSLLSDFRLKGITIGIPFVETAVAHNIFAFARQYAVLDDRHLTSHIGLEVFPPRDKQLLKENRAAFKVILTELRPFLSFSSLPYKHLPKWRKLMNILLNPSLPSRMYLSEGVSSLSQRWQHWLNDVRFRMMGR